MHWNEKIHQLKKQYSQEDFSVPHVDRKQVLKKIETKFVTRPSEYYNLNNATELFSNWWQHLNHSNELSSDVDLSIFLELILDRTDNYWIAAELEQGVFIYKGKRDPIHTLCNIGQTWTDSFYVIHLKYEFLIGIKLHEGKLTTRFCGEEKSVKKLNLSLKGYF